MAEIPTAVVTWRAVAIGQDTGDPGTDPEEIPLVGIKVRLTPNPRKVEIPATGTDPATTYTLREWDLTTGPDGVLINPQDTAAPTPIEIVASDAFPDITIEWTSTIDAPDAGVPAIAKRFLAPAGTTVDLTTVDSIPPGPSQLPAYLQAVADARAARDSAILAADRAETAEQGAGVARAAAEAARDETELISGLTGEDGAVAFLVDDPTSATSAALDSHSVVHRPAQGTTGGHEVGINGFLSANAGRVCRIVGDFTINGPIVIPTGTTLDATGATVTLAPGSRSRMVQNGALLGSGARDADVHLVGGLWDRGDNDGVASNDLHSILFHRVDRSSVRNVRVLSTHGKYAIYGVDVTDFTVDNVTLDTFSDGVHVTGPASRVRVRNITGTTGDDMVSFTARDFPTYELTPGGGDIDNVTVENVTMHNSTGGNIVKLLAGEEKVLSNALVANIHGQTIYNGVTLYSDSAQAATIGGTLRDITVRDVRVHTGGGYSAVHSNTAIEGLLLDGVTQHNPAAPSAVRIVGGTVDTVVARSVSLLERSTVSARTFAISSGAIVGAAILDAPIARFGSSGFLVHLASATLHRLNIINPNVDGGTAMVITNGIVDVVAISGGKVTNMAQLVDHMGEGALSLYVSGVDMVGTPLMVTARGGPGCSAVVRGGQLTGGSPVAVYGMAGQVVRAVGVDLKADITRAGYTPAAGDVVMNTNGAAPSGAGLHLRVGDTWTNLSSL